MDKVLSTILLVVAAVICVTLVINAVYPAITSSSGALSSVSARMNERIKSQIDIIHATGELDSDGVWQDTNSNGYFDVIVWVKNIGTEEIVDVKRCDVFLNGNQTVWAWIPHNYYASGEYPQWDYEIENGTEWGIATTTRIEISYESPLASGEYRIKILIPNGVSDEYYFGM
jgi:archaellum component FlaG (FlaF/FlaG flagellin family)